MHTNIQTHLHIFFIYLYKFQTRWDWKEYRKTFASTRRVYACKSEMRGNFFLSNVVALLDDYYEFCLHNYIYIYVSVCVCVSFWVCIYLHVRIRIVSFRRIFRFHQIAFYHSNHARTHTLHTTRRTHETKLHYFQRSKINRLFLPTKKMITAFI